MLHRLTAAVLGAGLAACGGTGHGILTVHATEAPGDAPASLAGGWHELPTSTLSARHAATAVWVDGSLVVFGGRDTPPCPPNADCSLPEEPPLRDGARFDPGTESWTSIADLPVAAEHASTAVDGGTVFVSTLSYVDSDWEPSFLSYDASSDRWEVLPLPPDAPDRWVADLEATEDGIVFPASTHENNPLADLIYDPATRAYTELPPDPLRPSFDRDLTFVDGRLVLTAIDISPSPNGSDGPARYRAATYTAAEGWRELPTGDVIGFNPEWLAIDGRLVNPTPGSSDGGEVNRFDRPYPHGGILDPASGVWSPLPDVPEIPDGESLRIARVVGDDRLAVGYDGWALLPEKERWVRIEPPPDGPGTDSAIAVGSGQLYLVGGIRWRETAGDHQYEAELFDRAWVYTPPRATPSPEAATTASEHPPPGALELVVDASIIAAGEDVSFWLVNHGTDELMTGTAFTIEHWDGERWIDVTTDDPQVAFPSVGIPLRPGEDSQTKLQSWPLGFRDDALIAGRYRITKDAYTETAEEPDRRLVASATFEIVP